MKTLISVLSVLFISGALACTDMVGSYNCATQDDQGNNVNIPLTVAIDLTYGFPVVTYNNSPIPADNKLYNLPKDEGFDSGTYIAYCSGTNKLVQEIKGQSNSISFEIITEDYMSDANTLVLTQTQTIAGASQSNEITCTRM